MNDYLHHFRDVWSWEVVESQPTVSKFLPVDSGTIGSHLAKAATTTGRLLNWGAGAFAVKNEQEAKNRTRRFELDQALLEHMIATKQFAESFVEFERIRNTFLTDDEDRALFGLPPYKEVKHQVKRVSKKWQ